MPLTDLQTIVEQNPVPFILDAEEEEKALSHKSLFGLPAHVQIAAEEPRDWERLAFLGDQILAFCTTEVIFERYATAKPSYLTVKRNIVVNNEQVAKWSQAYGFPQRMRAHPSQLHLLRANVTARASVFEAIVGAIFVTNGLERTESWLKPLIRHALDEAEEAEEAEKREHETKWRQEEEGVEADINQRFMGFGLGYEEDVGSPGERILPTTAFGNMASPIYGAPIPDNRTDITLNSVMSSSTAYSSYPLLQDEMHTPREGSNTPRASARGPYSAPSITSPGSGGPRFDGPLVDPRKAHSTGGGDFLRFHPNGSPSIGAYKSTRSTPANPTQRLGLQHAPSAHSSPGTGYHASPTAFSATSSASTNGFLALFNQIASQKHVIATWTAESTGPPHKPTFQARVIIDGEVKGEGTAYNKQTARHLAAKQALKTMRWHAE